MKKLVFLFAFSFLLFGCGSGNQVIIPKEIEPELFILKSETITPSLSLTGFVEAEKEIPLSSKITGRIDSLFVVVGDFVKKGQSLAKYSVLNDTNQTAYLNALTNLQTIENSAQNTVQSSEISFQNAKTEAKQTEVRERENLIRLEETLLTRTQNTDTLIDNVLYFLDKFVLASPRFRNSGNGLSYSVGQNDTIGKQQIKNETLGFINEFEKRNITTLFVIPFAEEKLEFLKQLKSTLTAFDQMVQNSNISSSFTESQKSSIQTQSYQILNGLNAEILGFENQIRTTKTAQAQINLTLLNVQNKVNALGSGLKLSQSQADNQVSQAKNQLALTSNFQKELDFKSPFNGIITQKFVEEGQLLTTGTVLFSLADVSGFKIRTQIPDTKIGQIKKGNSVEISLDGYDDAFIGTVTKLDPTVNPQTRKLGIEIQINNPDKDLKIGSFARLKVLLNEKPTMFVPRYFVFASFDGPFVVLENGDKVYVKTGIEKINTVEITSKDLKEDWVIVFE